ncbi:M23 family metallopeptidase [Geotalea toluenoxydans]|uniref:M23 family metallopeptidase n=1 Tax=Geotalea toluenoxydans TaxID=421624 RepID=UPI0006CF738D|nr:M23 family metallopeptidase [Geotalea toluenoxydans]
MKSALIKLVTITILLITIIFIGCVFPGELVVPVKDATKNDWNPKSFWFSPWGKSGVHKGIDIFAKEGTPVISACSGLVVSAESNGNGGNVVSILGAKWRIHYYAHLKAIRVRVGEFVQQGSEVGTVGTTGNAVGKTPHLHYAIITQIPYVWNYRSEKHGFDRIFFLNPHSLLVR